VLHTGSRTCCLCTLPHPPPQFAPIIHPEREARKRERESRSLAVTPTTRSENGGWNGDEGCPRRKQMQQAKKNMRLSDTPQQRKQEPENGEKEKKRMIEQKVREKKIGIHSRVKEKGRVDRRDVCSEKNSDKRKTQKVA